MARKNKQLQIPTTKYDHDLVYDGCSPHNGEYWYKCATCGKSDWIASYDTPDGLMSNVPCLPSPKAKRKIGPSSKGI